MTEPAPVIFLDAIEWREAIRQRDAAKLGEAPLRWNGLLDRLSDNGVRKATLRTLAQSGVHMSWHLMLSTILAAIAGKPLYHLCWGVGYHRGIRRKVARFVLRRARRVLVNEARTATEVAQLAGVRASQIPYVVDTDFYGYMPPAAREDFLFCPGANDRDGALLLALAQTGRRIVWMNNDANEGPLYEGRSDNLTIISFPSFTELRNLYQRAAAVILPLSRDVHAAGQTSALEAIACGAPVLISSGRTAELFVTRGWVTEVVTLDAMTWLAAIDASVADALRAPEAVMKRARQVADAHGVEPVTNAVRAVLAEL